LGAQVLAEVLARIARSDGQLHGHATSFTAKSVRLTIVRTSGTLYALRGSGVAPSAATRAASSIDPGVSGFPRSAASDSRARHGTGATLPSTMRASFTRSPSIDSATA